MPKTEADLRQQLQRIDGRGYPAYKDLRGGYAFADFHLFLDHIQGDPFAAPSRLRARVPLSDATFPEETRHLRVRCVALRDYLARAFSAACQQGGGRQGSGKSGLLAMDSPQQEILERSSIVVTDEYVEARFVAGLPAQGRRILGRQATALLCERLPQIVRQTLYYDRHDPEKLRHHLDTAEDAHALHDQLEEHDLVAFVANGSCLPRRSGIDDRPLSSQEAVLFQSPESLALTLELPHAGRVQGMGVPRGVTLIVGGGYHGKSTLLQALERGVYDHIPGDGRERVITDAAAVKIRAEDGRRVEGVDLSPFLHDLPSQANAAAFRSDNASGSTSQAANIIEALEVGASLLLLDEDTCATNLMIRDARMQALVEREGEPITPFVDRVRQLYQELGVSSILVLGGSGDYFDVADTVIRMDNYLPRDVTTEAQAIAQQHPTGREVESAGPWPPLTPRIPHASSLNPRKGKREVNIKSRALRAVLFGAEEIDLAAISQLVDEGQLRAIGRALNLARRGFMSRSEQRCLADVVDDVLDALDEEGLDLLDDRPSGDFVRFRPFEFAAALNRLRTLRVSTPHDKK